jgi:hypothetical protein
MGYKNVYRLSDYSERVSYLESSLKGYSNNSAILQQGKTRLSNDVKILQAKEKALFLKLGVKDEDELEQKFLEINQELSHLTGTYLKKVFIDPAQGQGDKNVAKFIAAAKEAIPILLREAEPEIFEAIEDTTIGKLTQVLNVGKGTGGKFGARKRVSFEDEIAFILATPSRKKRLETLMQEKYKKTKGDSKYSKFNKAMNDFIVTSGSSGEKTWLDITDMKSKNDSKSLSLEERKAKSEEIYQLILPHVGGVNLPLFRQVYQYLVQESNYSGVFVGRNVKDITGFLGELSGLYYLCRMFNCIPEQANSVNIEWRGGKINPKTNHEYHRDIILKGKGVQIKNTTKDLQQTFTDIRFWDVKLESFLERLSALGLSDYGQRELIENYFRTYEFNVPYVKEQNVFKKQDDVSNEAFRSEKERLKALSNDVNILLSCFAADFMYMEMGRSIDDITDANLLFLIGNSALKTASSLLRQAINALSTDPNNTPIKITSHLGEGGYNIVSALNRDKTLLRKQHAEEDSGKGMESINISTYYRFNLASFIPNG